MESADVAVSLARIETKLDAALASINDHEARLRAIEAAPQVNLSDHETRIRAIEATPTVSPKQLAAWLTLLLLVVSTVGPFLLAVL